MGETTFKKEASKIAFEFSKSEPHFRTPAADNLNENIKHLHSKENINHWSYFVILFTEANV